MESINDNKKNSEKQSLYFLFCFGLVGSGKTTVHQILKEEINNNYLDKINLLYISSDKIKSEKISEYMSTNKVSFQEAHDKINMKAKEIFNKTILKSLKTELNQNKLNLFVIDKLFFQDTIQDFYG